MGVLGYILFAIGLLSTLAGWFVVSRKMVEKPVKIILFVLYFWGFVFFQLIIFALFYQFDIANIRQFI